MPYNVPTHPARRQHHPQPTTQILLPLSSLNLIRTLAIQLSFITMASLTPSKRTVVEDSQLGGGKRRHRGGQGRTSETSDDTVLDSMCDYIAKPSDSVMETTISSAAFSTNNEERNTGIEQRRNQHVFPETSTEPPPVPTQREQQHDMNSSHSRPPFTAVHYPTGDHTSLPLSMRIIKPFYALCCQCCNQHISQSHPPNPHTVNSDVNKEDEATANDPTPSESSSSIRALQGSILNNPNHEIAALLQEFMSMTQVYGSLQANSGILTTIRFSLPTLRVSAHFHDVDMLALSDFLLKHCNGALSHITRLDFSVAPRSGKLYGMKGIQSHGAIALSRVLASSKHIKEVYLQRNRIGPYGAEAIFLAVARNPFIKTLIMRRCCVGERGAVAFAQIIGSSYICGLQEVDLSVNKMGFKGVLAIEEMLVEKQRQGRKFEMDIEGNLVLQEVMNGVTHGLGIVLSIVATIMMTNRARCADWKTCFWYAIMSLLFNLFCRLRHILLTFPIRSVNHKAADYIRCPSWCCILARPFIIHSSPSDTHVTYSKALTTAQFIFSSLGRTHPFLQ